MTATLAPPAVLPTPAARPNGLLLAFAAGGALACAVMIPHAWSVWNRGTFLDPDDAMRAVEVRDFLAGQGWFDLVPRRLSPEHPFVMHWSRLVDAPLAASERLFGLLMPPDAAERVTRLLAPVALFAVMLLATLRLVRDLVDARAMLPAACLLATSSELVTNFLPGHIHHHGAQAMLLVTASAALLRSLGPGGRASSAALAGLLATVSLGIGLQNLPFVVGLCGAAIGAWIIRGARNGLAGFGLGLCGAAPVFLLDVPPAAYAQGACDAFSAAHLLACLGVAAACFALSLASQRLPRPTQRLAAAAAAGGAVIGALAATFPACLGDPMAGVDPVLRTQWLAGVGEALPLAHLIALSPSQGIALALTLACGWAATLAATLGAAPAARLRWAALLLLGSIAVAGSLWQVRVAASACALFVPGLAALVLASFDRVSRRPARPALLAAVVVGMFGNGAGWSALAAPLEAAFAPGGHAARGDLASCFEPASFAALAALPPGLVLSSIDPGSAILAFTRHGVLAAPYHRNSDGNRVSLLGLAATPAAARPLIAASHARYLALCRVSNETAETAAEHPESLSAALLDGRVPDWLTPLDSPGPYAIFAIDAGPR